MLSDDLSPFYTMSEVNVGENTIPRSVSRSPRYEDEDISPTTKRELQGWYCYGMAAEVFAVTGSGSFLPVTIEQLARENGVLYSDRKTPCVEADAEAVRTLVERATEAGKDQCVVKFFGANVTTAAFTMYTFSIAVFIQALTLVSFSSVADHGDNRKKLLLFFAITGSVTAMCFIMIVPSIYPLASLLTVVAVTSLGCSFVMLNSFLPLLAANHPSVRALDKDFDIPPSTHTSTSPAAPTLGSAATSPASQLSNRISARGVGLGYSAAVFVQLCAILILFLASKVTSNRTFPLRVVLFVAGLWWITLTIPTARWLRKRPGPPLPSSLTKQKYATSRIRLAITYLTFAWFSLYRTLRLALSLSQTRLFLFAWFLLSDAIATVGSTAILFARTELALSPIGIACLSITATCSGIAGSVLWPILARRFAWKTNRTIVFCLCLMEIIPLYGLLSYIPAVQRLGWLGLQQAWEIFPLAVIHGVSMGGLSSYCRSFFGQLIPPGHEVAFYALFAITDKGSSAVGPAVVGRIVDATGSIRPAFWFLTVLVALPMVIIGNVNEEKGRSEAARVAKSISPDELNGGIELPLGPSVARHGEEREALMAQEC